MADKSSRQTLTLFPHSSKMVPKVGGAIPKRVLFIADGAEQVN